MRHGGFPHPQRCAERVGWIVPNGNEAVGFEPASGGKSSVQWQTGCLWQIPDSYRRTLLVGVPNFQQNPVAGLVGDRVGHIAAIGIEFVAGSSPGLLGGHK